MTARLRLLVIAAASAAVGMTLGFVGSVSGAATTSASSWIVYSEGKRATIETHGLRLLNVKTGAQRPLAPNQFAARPSWSPNGTRVVFEDAGVRKAGYGTPQISVISLRSGSIHRITYSLPSYDEYPAWSPSGGQIAFTRSMTKGHDGIWLVNAIGGKEHQLTKTPENAGDSRPRWSPNGRQIAFVRYTSGNPGTYDLWVMQANGTGQHLLVADAYTSTWSPDGTKLAISRPTGQTRTGCACLVTDLYLRDADGTNPRLLIRNGGSATWSPDGEQIVFTRWQGARTHLWTINTDGTGLRQLTHGPKSQGSAAWKPSPS